MRFRLALSTLVFAVLLTSTPNGVGSLNGSIDYSNPRIVPFLTSKSTTQTQGSGFLYSSRIVLTAGHLAHSFDQAGNILPLVRENYVGLPNTKVTEYSRRVKVIEKFVAKSYRSTSTGALDDFAVFVLEEDLIDANPVELMNPEIEKNLVSSNVPVFLHGYGNFEDKCKEGQQTPCTGIYNSSTEPRMILATLHTMDEFQTLVGYSIPQLKNELLFFTPGKQSMCSGDSGGSLTTKINGKLIYIANIGTAQGIYACGQGKYDGKGGINYSAPVYRHLELIREAEAFVESQKKKEVSFQTAKPISKESTNIAKTKTITCFKGKVTKKVSSSNPKCPAGYKKR